MTNLTPGIKSLRRIQFGKESTAGTKIQPTVLWRGEGTLKNDLAVVNPVEDIGIVIDTTRAYIPSKGGTLTLEATPATFEQLPYLGEMGIKAGSGVADGAGSGYIYTYPLPIATKNTISNYSLEAGDDRQTELAQYMFAENIKLSGKYNESIMMSASCKTRAVSPNSVTGTTISFDNSNSILDSANGFGGFLMGQRVEVSGTTLNDGIFTITSVAAGELGVTETTATEAAGSSFTVEQVFTLLTVPAVEEMNFNQSKLYIDAVGGTIGTTQKSNTFLSFDLDLITGWKGQATGSGRLDFSFAKVTKPNWTLNITFEHDGTATAEKAAWIAGTPRLIRIKNEGPVLGTAGTTYTYKTMIVDVPGIYTDFSALTDDDGNDTVVATLKGGYDLTAALGGQIIVVNELSALT
jgi:hypothetical protein